MLDFPEFVPSRLVRGGNLQTVGGSFLPPPREPQDTMLHRVLTTCDDWLALHSNQPSKNPSSTRQVVLLHGLAGSHASSYMIRATVRLLEAGFGVWRMDSRGSGAGISWARYHHHAGRAEDLNAAIQHVQHKQPDCPVTVIGFSLGANVVLNWLGGAFAEASPAVDSAIAVAPPIDLEQCSQNLRSGISRGYDLYFARQLVARLKRRRLARPDMVDFPLRQIPETLQQFDIQFTVPAGGFQDIDDYYQSSSSCQRLSAVTIPTLLLVDGSDPVIPIHMFEQARLSSAIHLLKTGGGGHLGYLARRGIDPDCHWLSWRIADAVRRFDTCPGPWK